MKKNTRFALSALAGLGIAAAAVPALAADVVYEEPPAPQPIFDPAPVSTWAGPYAGVQAGYNFSGSTDGPAGVSIDTDGWQVGAFAGYNFQNDRFVYGAEVDINYNDVSGTIPGFQARSKVDGSLRGRAGIAVTDDILVYGTAGLAVERQRVFFGNEADTNVMLGYTVGAGVDAKLTDQVFARAEYRFTDYGSEDFDIGAASGSYDSSNHRVTLGLGVKF